MTTSSAFPSVHRTDLDGLPLIWADLPGVFQAALIFRVGRADETLATSGRTHLVEHLALSGDPHDGYDQNGYVDQIFTVFHARGEPEDVLAFMAEVAARLRQLPTEGLKREVQVLLTEEASSPPHPAADLERIRYGAGGYGLVGHDQIGLHRLTESDVQAWADGFFSRQNAVLILTGAPPREVSLPLPPGSRVRPPDVMDTTPRGQFWMPGREGAVALGMVSGKFDGLGLALRCASRRIFQSLRRQRGLTYAVDVVDDELGSSLVHRVLLADCVEKSAREVRDGMLEVVDEIAESGPAEDEIRAERALLMRDLREPDAMFEWMRLLAEGELVGDEPMEIDDYVAKLLAVGTEQAQRALRVAVAGAHLLLPPGLDGPGDPWQALPEANDEPVVGTSFRRAGLGRWLVDERCVVGESGISMWGDGSWMTIPWARVAALIRPEPNVLSVVDRHGGGINLDLSAWRRSDSLARDLRSKIPDRLYVDLVEQDR